MQEPGRRALAAVSGGVDSMVMLTVMHRLGYALEVATCNFGLRPEAEDEVKLVEAYAAKLGVKCHSKKIEIKDTDYRGPYSIQMLARMKRYQWFFELQGSTLKDQSPLLTAHHLDDHTETILLNLFRFKHHKLITGIPRQWDHIYRPLLCLTKDEIRQYAMEEGIPWAEDKSNHENLYLRNVIRNKLLPVLKEINPNVQQHIREAEARSMMQEKVLKSIRKQISTRLIHKNPSDQGYLFPLSIIDEFPMAWEDYLHSHLGDEEHSYAFRVAVCELVTSQPGKYVEEFIMKVTRTHDALDFEILNFTLATSWGGTWTGVSGEYLGTENFSCLLEIIPWKKGDPIPRDPNVYLMDADKIQLPVRFRLWQHGDRMQPLGVKGYKKISDILVNDHVSVTDKRKRMVFEDQKQIICLSHFRISEAVKVDDTTTSVLRISFTYLNHGV